MSLLSSAPYQDRRFELTHLLKVKEEISLKTLDLSQVSLFKNTFSAKELFLSETLKSKTPHPFPSILEKFGEKEAPSSPQKTADRLTSVLLNFFRLIFEKAQEK